MIFDLVVFLLFWGDTQSKLVRDCYWLADQFEPSPNLSDLTKHRNFKLLPHATCGNWKWETPDSRKKIFRGTDASNNQYPWLAKANLFGTNDGVIHCGGTIINNRYILTAAHCCEAAKSPTQITWYLGSDYYYHNNRSVATEKIHIPEGYFNCTEGEATKHDVCVVRLAENIVFNENIQPICTPITAEFDQGTKLEVAGFGITDPDEWATPPIVQKKTVTVVGQNLCREKFSAVDAREVCATYGTCHGDSGGPLMQQFTIGNSTAYWLLGITSYGDPDCGIGSITVYMRVTEYIGWILDVMEP